MSLEAELMENEEELSEVSELLYTLYLTLDTAVISGYLDKVVKEMEDKKKDK